MRSDLIGHQGEGSVFKYVVPLYDSLGSSGWFPVDFITFIYLIGGPLSIWLQLSDDNFVSFSLGHPDEKSEVQNISRFESSEKGDVMACNLLMLPLLRQCKVSSSSVYDVTFLMSYYHAQVHNLFYYTNDAWRCRMVLLYLRWGDESIVSC